MISVLIFSVARFRKANYHVSVNLWQRTEDWQKVNEPDESNVNYVMCETKS